MSIKFFSYPRFLQAFGLFIFVGLLVSCSSGIERFASQGAGGLLGGENGVESNSNVFSDSAANLPVPSSVTSSELQPATGATGALVVEPPAVVAPPAAVVAPQPIQQQPAQQQVAIANTATNTSSTNNSDYLRVPEAASPQGVSSESEFVTLPSIVPIPKAAPNRQSQQPAQPAPAATQPATQQQTQQLASTTTTTTTTASDISALRWPVKGKVISNFGEQQDGIGNDGIDISVPVGTPIKAAESGLVIYASNELKEFGNLILITHDGGLVTAYAYNEANHVKKGDKVNRGDVIAASGNGGNAKSPRLHFQVRKDKKPVDPTLYLSTN